AATKNGGSKGSPTRADLAELLAAAPSLEPRLVALRRAIHADPELGLATPRTREKLIEALADCGLELTLHARSSGFVATLRGGARAATRARRILLRGDMDALPVPEETCS